MFSVQIRRWFQLDLFTRIGIPVLDYYGEIRASTETVRGLTTSPERKKIHRTIKQKGEE